MLSLLIIAADAGADATAWLPAVSAIGSLGFAVWYAYYTTTVAIPKLLESHRVERTEMQARFDGIMDKLVTEMRQQRECNEGNRNTNLR